LNSLDEAYVDIPGRSVHTGRVTGTVTSTDYQSIMLKPANDNQIFPSNYSVEEALVLLSVCIKYFMLDVIGL